jgi:peptidoglycan hydrolase-like protein with peptidoglycan-binding domain
MMGFSSGWGLLVKGLTMRQGLYKSIAWAGTVALCASLAFAAAPQKSASSQKNSNSKHHSSKKTRKPGGQQAIDTERCSEIQEALVREHYLSGKPSGKWDDSTQQAMRRYQADQGWQNKSVPDSRALIRLGLGPDHEHLLNPETAMTSQPQLPSGHGTRSRVSSFSGPATQPGSASQTSLPGGAASSPVTSAPELSPAR